MRVALISDLHANGIALRAVLRDIEHRGADRIVCLGDVATLGPEPAETVHALRELGCDCIEGNHDAYLLDPVLVRDYDPPQIVVESVDWCRDQLDVDDLEFVETFGAELEIDLGADASLALYHGTPRSHTEDLLPTTPPEEVDAMLDGRRATVLAGGHTHVQMLRQHRGMMLVNTGSVGAPFREFPENGSPTVLSRAEYATVDADGGSVSVTLHRVPLDRHELARAAHRCGNPIRELLRRQYG